MQSETVYYAMKSLDKLEIRNRSAPKQTENICKENFGLESSSRGTHRSIAMSLRHPDSLTFFIFLHKFVISKWNRTRKPKTFPLNLSVPWQTISKETQRKLPLYRCLRTIRTHTHTFIQSECASPQATLDNWLFQSNSEAALVPRNLFNIHNIFSQQQFTQLAHLCDHFLVPEIQSKLQTNI